MIGLLTWPACGTWLPGPARGWIDADIFAAAPPQSREPEPIIPEPDVALSMTRRRSLKWPAVMLSEQQQRLVLDDLARIARLRCFRLFVAVAAEDHIHALLAVGDDRDISRLVQLIKGALSRKLSIAAGDAPARGRDATPLPHHKWWTRQYSFRRIACDDDLGFLRLRLMDHQTRGASARSDWPEDVTAAGDEPSG